MTQPKETAAELLERLHNDHRSTKKARHLGRLTLGDLISEIKRREPKPRRRRIIGGGR